MKITFISYIYPHPDRGYNPGVERVVQEFARELVDQDHEVHVLTTYRNGGTEQHELDEGVHIHRFKDSRYYLGRVGSVFSIDHASINFSIRKYSDLLEESDIVHTFTPIVDKLFTTPLVSHYHHWDNSSNLMDYLYLPTSHKMWLYCYEVSDRIIAVSSYSAEDLSKRGPDKSKIRVVPNGVDKNVFKPGDSSVDLGLWDNTLLYVGPLSERKGLKYLIMSLPDIVAEHKNTGLIIVGGGEKETLIALAESLGVQDSIRFEGFVPDSKLPEYYRAADLFVFPSLLEGFGMVLLEAMASGLPVVASDTTAIPEVVGTAGCLVRVADPQSMSSNINSLLNNPTKMESLSNQAMCRVNENFTWSKSVEKLVSEYSELLV